MTFRNTTTKVLNRYRKYQITCTSRHRTFGEEYAKTIIDKNNRLKSEQTVVLMWVSAPYLNKIRPVLRKSLRKILPEATEICERTISEKSRGFPTLSVVPWRHNVFKEFAPSVHHIKQYTKWIDAPQESFMFADTKIIIINFQSHDRICKKLINQKPRLSLIDIHFQWKWFLAKMKANHG